MWLVIVLAAFVGVWFGLWWRKTLNVVIGTTIFYLAIIGVMIGIQNRDILGYDLYRFAGLITVNIFGMDNNPFFYSINWTVLTFICTPLVLIVPVLYFAVHNARKPQ